MKKRTLICLSTALVIGLSCAEVYDSYAATTFKSQGKIVYTNNSPDDPTDDVVFDAGDLVVMDTTVTNLDTRITNLSIQIDSGIDKVVDALEKYPGIELGNDGGNGNGGESAPTFDDIVIAINNLTNIPADTYFYEDGTQGDESIVRYKKVNGKYYSCNEHGEVAQGAAEVNVSGKKLIDYKGAISGNMSAGAGAYANGKLHLGNGFDNEVYKQQGNTSGEINGALNVVNGMTYVPFTISQYDGTQSSSYRTPKKGKLMLIYVVEANQQVDVYDNCSVTVTSTPGGSRSYAGTKAYESIVRGHSYTSDYVEVSANTTWTVEVTNNNCRYTVHGWFIFVPY